MGVRAAHLRRLHAGARHRVGPRGRGRAQVRDSGQRRPRAQPDDRRAVRARPRHALLPPARARLGRRGVRTGSGPCGDRDARAVAVELPPLLARLLRGRAEATEDVRRGRAARHLRERLLGSPGVQAPAGGQPDGGGPLPRCARLAARRRAAAHDLRRQEPASPLRGGWRAEPDRPQLGLGDQLEAARAGPGHHHADARVRGPGLPARHDRDRGLLQGLGGAGRRARQFHVLRRLPGARDERPEELPDTARRDSRPRPLDDPRGGPARRGTDPGVRFACLVRLRRRQGRGPAPVRWRDPPQLHGSAAALPVPRRREAATRGSSRHAGRARPSRSARSRGC